VSTSVGNADTARPRPKGWARDLLPRVVSAVVLLAVAGAALYWAAWSFNAVVVTVALVLAWEWTRLCGESRFGLAGFTQGLSAFVIVVAAALGAPAVALVLIPFAALAAFLAGQQSRIAHPGWNALGPLYVGLPCVSIIWLRAGGDGALPLVVWLMVTVWAADIAAYFVGRLVGGPKLAPRISPNKTWAGLGGALLGAAAAGLAIRAAIAGAPPAATMVLASIALAIVAQGGDLLESWIKRKFGVKDSSGLIPGHGGMFDRVDGLLAAASGLALWQWLTEGGVLSWR
jgi:phosphatidate cytidylyltransferase